MNSFDLNKWMDSYIDSQTGMTDREKAQAKYFRKPEHFRGLAKYLEEKQLTAHTKIYVRLRAMSRVFKIGCASKAEAETATAFYEYLLYKSEIEKKVAKAPYVERKVMKVGWIKTVSDLVRTEKESKGFLYLRNANRLDVSLEYFALMNQHIFEKDVVDSAYEKLRKYGTYYR